MDQAIASAPRSFTLYDRDGNPHADLGGDRVHFVPGSSGSSGLDHRTGEVRLANSTDFVEYIRLGDGLDHIAYLATAFSTNADIEAAGVRRLAAVHGPDELEEADRVGRVHRARRAAHGRDACSCSGRTRADLVARPMSMFTITATGNFRYSEDSCQNLIDCVEAGIPVEIVPVTLMGLVAPVTTVGATVFHTIDVLAGITMAQVIRPGAPVMFGGAPATFHMKKASSPMAAIEAFQLDAAYVEVGKALGLPCQSYMALSDSPILDAQAGAETFGSALIAALAGVNSVSGPGLLDFLLVFSMPKLVFDDEMCGQALRFTREVRVQDDLPIGPLVERLMTDQHLIMADHTSAHWPTELHLPSPVIDRDNRETWLKAGGKDTYARACDEVDRRLARYRPVETDPAADVELRRIILSGLEAQTELPYLPPAPEPIDDDAAALADPTGPARGRRVNARRRAH